MQDAIHGGRDIDVGDYQSKENVVSEMLLSTREHSIAEFSMPVSH